MIRADLERAVPSHQTANLALGALEQLDFTGAPFFPFLLFLVKAEQLCSPVVNEVRPQAPT